MRRPLTYLLLLVFAPSVLAAQNPGPATATDTTGAYLDAGAAALMNRAREARLRSDRSLRSYTAIVKSRLAAGLRMPLKDRTLFRQESAARVRWSRDSTILVQMLAGRTQHPGGVEIPNGIDELYDPANDRMYFGLTKVERNDERPRNDDYWIEHPLGTVAERHYRYQTGDTIALRLQDGREVRVVELRVIPRRSDPHTVRGMMWLDTQTGILVQAAFRLARTVDLLRDRVVDDDDIEDMSKIPGFLKPFEFDISLMTVEYSLWEMQHWLPRSMRFDGVARAGAVSMPATAEFSYQILDVTTDAQPNRVSETEAIRATLEEWRAEDDYRERTRRSNGRRMRVLVPRDSSHMLRSPHLPPPVWSNAPGFPTDEELKQLYDRVADVAGPSRQEGVPVTFGWGLGEPGMARYNRVEALSLGARVTVPLPYARIEAEARIGAGDLRPNGALSIERATMYRTLELRGFHELMTVTESRAALGFGNSVSALVLGRDEGEYYRATGALFNISPASTRRHTYDLRAYVERQRAVERNTHVALPRMWNDSVFRENIVADAATQFGALLHLRPWWGTDPQRAQFGIDLLVQGEVGDYEHGRGRITLRTAVPISDRIRVGAEAAVGSSTGDVPSQRFFYLGGASTLRGYEPNTVNGTSMARGRFELARAYDFGNLAVFTDWGWAGDRDNIRKPDQRWAVGAGASLLDGLMRIDLAHGLRAPRGWRLDLHLDAIL